MTAKVKEATLHSTETMARHRAVIAEVGEYRCPAIHDTLNALMR